MASIAAATVGIMGREHCAPSVRSGHIRIKVGVANKVQAFLNFHFRFFTLLGAAIVWQARQPSLTRRGFQCSLAHLWMPRLQDNQTAPLARGVTPMLRPSASALQAAQVMLSTVLAMRDFTGAG